MLIWTGKAKPDATAEPEGVVSVRVTLASLIEHALHRMLGDFPVRIRLTARLIDFGNELPAFQDPP